jgi:hypothetical protein
VGRVRSTDEIIVDDRIEVLYPQVCLNLSKRKFLAQQAEKLIYCSLLGWRKDRCGIHGQNIWRVRKARGLKQTALAESCGYSAKGSGTRSKIKRGHLVIDMIVADRSARACGVQPTELFVAPEGEVLTNAPQPLPAGIRRILDIWQALGPNDLQTV